MASTGHHSVGLFSSLRVRFRYVPKYLFGYTLYTLTLPLHLRFRYHVIRTTIPKITLVILSFKTNSDYVYYYIMDVSVCLRRYGSLLFIIKA